MELLLQLIFLAMMLSVGYFWGTHAEKKHYRSIIQREKQSTDIIITATKYAPETGKDAELVIGSVVVASDYFKRFVAWLIGIFGGKINVYESLLDRARREAVLRMKEDARLYKANMIVNVKFETATLNNINRQGAAMVEVLAYGTAIKYPMNQPTE